ncbi:hypothetical protein ABIC08_008315 [Bradyrhizobium sp. RT9b]|uniref:hypothetical protein n=1 Tax=unclassified Bradyrhizobium TaxID=2631580 RepID=UPI00339870B7
MPFVRERIKAMLPADQRPTFWACCLNALPDWLLDVLAVAAARGIDAVQRKNGCKPSGQSAGTGFGVRARP